jgi:hypothetical protein
VAGTSDLDYLFRTDVILLDILAFNKIEIVTERIPYVYSILFQNVIIIII